MHPNKIKSAFRKERKRLGETYIHFEVRIAKGNYSIFSIQIKPAMRAQGSRRSLIKGHTFDHWGWQPMKKHLNCKD